MERHVFSFVLSRSIIVERRRRRAKTQTTQSRERESVAERLRRRNKRRERRDVDGDFFGAKTFRRRFFFFSHLGCLREGAAVLAKRRGTPERQAQPTAGRCARRKWSTPEFRLSRGRRRRRRFRRSAARRVRPRDGGRRTDPERVPRPVRRRIVEPAREDTSVRRSRRGRGRVRDGI